MCFCQLDDSGHGLPGAKALLVWGQIRRCLNVCDESETQRPRIINPSGQLFSTRASAETESTSSMRALVRSLSARYPQFDHPGPHIANQTQYSHMEHPNRGGGPCQSVHWGSCPGGCFSAAPAQTPGCPDRCQSRA